jgi:hypothetical protein
MEESTMEEKLLQNTWNKLFLFLINLITMKTNVEVKELSKTEKVLIFGGMIVSSIAIAITLCVIF